MRMMGISGILDRLGIQNGAGVRRSPDIDKTLDGMCCEMYKHYGVKAFSSRYYTAMESFRAFDPDEGNPAPLLKIVEEIEGYKNTIEKISTRVDGLVKENEILRRKLNRTLRSWVPPRLRWMTKKN